MKFEPIKLGYCFLLIAAFSFYLKSADANIKGLSDLYLTKGHLHSYDFKNGFKGSYDYTFKLKEFSNHFQVKADFSSIFQAEEFKKLEEAEELSLSIYKNEAECLNNSTYKIRIYSLESSKSVFLDMDAALKIHNSNSLFYFLVLMTCMGLLLIIHGYLGKRKKR